MRAYNTSYSTPISLINPTLISSHHPLKPFPFGTPFLIYRSIYKRSAVSVTVSVFSVAEMASSILSVVSHSVYSSASLSIPETQKVLLFLVLIIVEKCTDIIQHPSNTFESLPIFMI